MGGEGRGGVEAKEEVVVDSGLDLINVICTL